MAKKKTTQEKNLDKKIKEVDKKEKEIDKKIKELDKKEKEIDKKISKVKKSASKFKSEFKKSTNTAIIAAFSFLIALAWRDLISEVVDKVSALSPVQGKLISAVIITIIAVLGIMITTKIFAEKEE